MKLIPSKPKNSSKYEVEIHFFHGDMDSGDERSFFFNTELETIALLKELKRLNKSDGYGVNYYRPEGRVELEEYVWKVETSSKLINKLFRDWDDEDWPRHYDYDSYAALHYWKIYYWDEQGRRVEMEIKK